uniref:Nascent polypeptide-associated complex subunit alpha-like UBA domain-containing protein n=1 Tax=Acrobeloides nanus TaxID=290746 RepID=A0A914C999_9BILA
MPKKPSNAKQSTASSDAQPDEESTSTNANTLEADEAETNAQTDKQVDKKQAADLERVTDFHEDKDEMNEVTKESLGNLMVSTQSPKKRVQIRQEDIRMIIDELEVTKYLAEKKLYEHNGDIKAAMRDIMGFN